MDPLTSGDGETKLRHVKPFAQAKLLSLTEKCKICGDQAARHIHYGAMSCFSCRAFFRRSIQNKTAPAYTCRRFNKCDINLRTRKNCQACRFQKCLSVGMKPSWVLTEEERKVRFKKSTSKGGLVGEDDDQNLVILAGTSTHSQARRSNAASKILARTRTNSDDMIQEHEQVESQEAIPLASPPATPSNLCPGFTTSSPSFGGFIKESPAVSALNKEIQIGAMLGDELLVGQGMIKEVNKQSRIMIESPVVVSTSTCKPSTIKEPATVSTSRQTVLKIKEEPVSIRLLSASNTETKESSRSPKEGPSSSASSSESTSNCSSVTTQNFGIIDKSHQDIKDVLKDDPDFNNIDIDLIEASLMEDGGRQLKIDVPLNDDTSAGIRINDLVAQLSKSYDLSPTMDDMSDDEDSCFSTSQMLSPDEETYLETLVASHDEHYRSVNFGEEMIKEMMMCSMFGIPISSDAAINGYKLCVERITKIARNLKEFIILTYVDQSALLKENADLLVCLRGAIFFDPKKSGVDQVLVSMGFKDMELLNTMFSQAMKEVGNMKHIEYKTFNSVQNVTASAKEARYKYIQERVGKFLEDDTVTVLITLIVLFSSDFCTQLQDPVLVSETQERFISLLQKYSNTKYAESGGRLDSCMQVAQCMEVISMLREMADMKKARNMNITTLKV